MTSSVDVTYELRDNSWVAADLGELQKALLGGLDTLSATSASSTPDSAAAAPDTGASAGDAAPADAAADEPVQAA